jgi:tetratricopeptide (TPR) repeat protein
VEHLQKAIGIKPDRAYLHANLGLQYRHSGRSELALPCFHEAIRIKPEPQTYCMLGGVYGEAQQIESAEECFKKAIDLDPQFAPAHCDLATIHQLRGNWGDGWKEYEWRFEAYEQVKYWLKLYDHSKRWYGEPVDGKRVLLHNEQGTGDSIHFFRYVTLLREQECLRHHTLSGKIWLLVPTTR